MQERAEAQGIRIDITYQTEADLRTLHQAAAAPDVLGVLLVMVDDAMLARVHDLPVRRWW